MSQIGLKCISEAAPIGIVCVSKQTKMSGGEHSVVRKYLVSNYSSYDLKRNVGDALRKSCFTGTLLRG